MENSLQQLIAQMAQDISTDIYGDISGHEYYAEEIIRLRAIIAEHKESQTNA